MDEEQSNDYPEKGVEPTDPETGEGKLNHPESEDYQTRQARLLGVRSLLLTQFFRSQTLLDLLRLARSRRKRF